MEFVENDCQNTTFVCSLDRMASSNRFTDALMPKDVANTSFITTFAAFVKKKLYRIIDDIRFESPGNSSTLHIE